MVDHAVELLFIVYCKIVSIIVQLIIAKSAVEADGF